MLAEQTAERSNFLEWTSFGNALPRRIGNLVIYHTGASARVAKRLSPLKRAIGRATPRRVYLYTHQRVAKRLSPVKSMCHIQRLESTSSNHLNGTGKKHIPKQDGNWSKSNSRMFGCSATVATVAVRTTVSIIHTDKILTDRLKPQ